MQLFITNDGSHTVINEGLNITYHSKYGAIQESQHVFLEAGLQYFFQNNIKRPIQVFEMGFGTGLNALLALDFSNKNKVHVQYHAVETDKVTTQIIEQLNYKQALNLNSELTELHYAAWDKQESYWDYFTLHKQYINLHQFEAQQQYDVVFYHAFTPAAQPDLWTSEVFARIYNMMADDGVLVTYCCKSEVRRTMQAVGFEVHKIAGPPGKREMLRAIKKGIVQ